MAPHPLTRRPHRSTRSSWLLAARLALAGAATAAVATVAADRVLSSLAGAAASRTNYRGTRVSLAGGPALAVAGSVTAAAGALVDRQGSAMATATLVAGLGAGGVGLYDDLVGGRPGQQAKGFRGHLGALREGRVTSGAVKIVGVGLAGLAAAGLVEAERRGEPGGWRRAARVGLGAGVIAGGANLWNLLDLRPGRALKAGVLAGAPLAMGRRGALVAGPVGATLGLLPADLDEQVMLGDSGANALGALLGVAYLARTGALGRAVALAALAGLTVASERVSFTAVIARTPGLRELDELGRRPA